MRGMPQRAFKCCVDQLGAEADRQGATKRRSSWRGVFQASAVHARTVRIASVRAFGRPTADYARSPQRDAHGEL